MKRKIYQTLLNWKKRDAEDTALLIDGARRVGKSYIAEAFAKAEYRSYVLIDFNNLPPEVAAVFENDLVRLEDFYRKIAGFYNVRLYPGETLFIFDEVQKFPQARAAIKYLMEKPLYHFIETGSLVSIRENVGDIVIPSEEEHVKMYPLDFEEFLWATGREDLAEVIAEYAKQKMPMELVHRRAMDALREYMTVGGMPQAVAKWVKTGDLASVDKVKRRILSLYRADIRKHAGRYSLKAERVFDKIPAALSRHEKKFQLSALSTDARRREYDDAFMWLEDAMVVNMSYNSTEPSAALAMSADHATLKCYMADTGLLVSHAFSASALKNEEIHRRLLFGELDFNEGMVVENLAAQMLAASGHRLFFYSRSDRKNAANTMEVDFVVGTGSVGKGHNATAIEVKSGDRYTITSLRKYIDKFGHHLAGAHVFHLRDVTLRDEIHCFPLYMLPWVL